MLFTLLKYSLVGVINTLTHWGIFLFLTSFYHLEQSLGNLTSFYISASISFTLNSIFTFQKKLKFYRYILFLIIMGNLSFLTGYLADQYLLSFWFTLITFSSLSLILGFLFSNFLIFKVTK